MGLLATITSSLADHLEGRSIYALCGIAFTTFFILAVLLNVLSQLVHARTRGTEPPIVFHWIPFIGSTITYGIDPFVFFSNCRAKYGDVFTFILLGKKTTVCLGTKGNDFILNGKLKDVNAEEIYSPLTTPVFGSDVVYDCPNAKLMEQKKFVKFGLTSEALKSYVELISAETKWFADTSDFFKGTSGTLDIPKAMAELTIYTASRSLQGKEVRQKFDSTFADLYHDLDMGFTPINFMLPWAPLPQNRKRDRAQRKMAETYMEIITARRKAQAAGEQPTEKDMIWNLMGCTYKDGTDIPDKEIAHMMIALLMAGQHSSSATITWIVLRLASRPDIVEELLQEQQRVLGKDLPALEFDHLARLPLHSQVVKETLRIHAPIHSIMRAVKQPMPIEGTPFVIPPTHVLLSAPGVTSREEAYFPDPMLWEPHRWDEDTAPVTNTKATEKAQGYQRLRPVMPAESSTAQDEKTDYGYGLVSKGANSPYLPFGAGRHRCIGEQFAYTQLQTILATLVRDFKFRNTDGSDQVVGTDYSSLFSRPLAPAVVAWERRHPVAEKSEKS